MCRGEDALAALHQADVAGDAEDPGADALRLAQLVEALEDLEQGLLGDFFGVLGAAAHQPAVVKDLGAEVLDEPLEGIGLAGQQRACQSGFHQLVHAPIVAPGGGEPVWSGTVSRYPHG